MPNDKRTQIEIVAQLNENNSPRENADNVIEAFRDGLAEEAYREADSGDESAAHTAALVAELDARITHPLHNPGEPDLRHLVDGDDYVEDADQLIRQVAVLSVRLAEESEEYRETLLQLVRELKSRIDGRAQR